MESGHFLHNHNTKDDRTIADEAKNQDVNCFLVDDLLDFSNDEIAGFIGDGSTTEDDQSKYWQQSGSSAYSSPKTTTGSNVSPPPEIDCSFKLSDNHLDNFENRFKLSDNHLDNFENLCIPGDDLGELEWLSNFVEDAFSAKEAIPIGGGLMTFMEDGHVTTCYSNSNEEFIACNQREKERKEIVFNVPGRARSKRSRIPACDLSSRRISIAKPYSPPPTQNIEVQYGFVSMPEQEHQQFVEVKKTKPTKYPSSCSTSSSSSSSQIMFQDDFQHRAPEQNHHHHHQGPMRKCTHCETTQTPQWRAGPKGPKTLCNACGVRFKSGRLVPEYRPASSPTFVPSKHSNSHRKVMEMRRHKEVSVFHHVRSKPIATSSIKYSPSNEYHRRDNSNDQFSSWFAGSYNDDESYLLPTKHDYRQLVL